MERDHTEQTSSRGPQHEQPRTEPHQTEQPQPEQEHSHKQPADTLRDGHLKSAIWRNETENSVMHSATFSRTYRDQDGNYRDSQSFAGADLLRLSELARQTYTRSNELQREAIRENSERESEERKAEFKCQRGETHDAIRNQERDQER
ncbi:hypothetical protein T8K17_25215 [Thalassobaculum sp. OXR-137]|uniref:hypothetical protein n=1 Tax=Thalassobaculum sp. OXR-137 TaxID=3100173 RepID=UPI002AC948A4|nr:hypothetical protein [Thalassobaculum sp. OXR-137]WPZ34511.1 hypothetical protein T8K17_25215 [Thalassobaculum sp. OXR-137]